jgi:hypothetical protein
MSIIFRPGLPILAQSASLGPLAGLPGTWTGRGFNQIFLPDFDPTAPSTGPKPFRVLLNATRETLEFTPIGAAVPNRGSEQTGSSTVGQLDINLFGVRYLQQINDLNSNEPLHLEPGFWLNVPATTIPSAPASIFRQGSIPHGTSILAQGTGFASPTGKPVFPVLNTTPVKNPNVAPPLGAGYLAPIAAAPLPAPFTNAAIVQNPNLVLAADIADVINDITATEVLSISTTPTGGVLNIPFLQNTTNNTAAVLSFSAIFWIETVKPPGRCSYQILQYSQTIILNFLGINWPHTTVATLYLQ